MIRVAFPLLGGALWTAGRTYLLNLFATLERFSAGRVTPLVLAPLVATDEELQPFRDIRSVEIVRVPGEFAVARTERWLRALIVGRDSKFQAWLASLHADLLFEQADYYGWRPAVPVLAWMPDLQHRTLPGMFSAGNWWRRELGFRMQARAPRTIMVSSLTSRDECERYYAASRGRTVVVRFAVPADDDTGVDPAIPGHYGLPRKFFYLPNQFWRHKNHLLVIEAVARMRRLAPDIVIACSGNPLDPRHPGHFGSVELAVKSAGVGDLFRMLGMIPYTHVRGLMRNAAALVNPSLSEGWSTTVEEAKSLGVPLVLSDIAVHREQAGAAGLYFDPSSADSAATVLAEAWSRYNQPGSAIRLAESAPLSNERAAQFASDFIGAAALASGKTC